MNQGLVQHWNVSNQRIPGDRDRSPYAADKEALFQRNANICDVGGGIGTDTLYFLRQGHTVTLIDISDAALGSAQARVREAGYTHSFQSLQVDLGEGRIPQPDSSFDVVFSRLALHYFKREISVSLYKEILRILKEGGKAYIAVKSVNDGEEMRYLRETAKEVEPGIFEGGDGILKSRFTPEQIQSVLTEAGIAHFDLSEYTEKVGGRNDVVKSGNEELLYTDITISKY